SISRRIESSRWFYDAQRSRRTVERAVILLGGKVRATSSILGQLARDCDVLLAQSRTSPGVRARICPWLYPPIIWPEWHQVLIDVDRTQDDAVRVSVRWPRGGRHQAVLRSFRRRSVSFLSNRVRSRARARAACTSRKGGFVAPCRQEDGRIGIARGTRRRGRCRPRAEEHDHAEA